MRKLACDVVYMIALHKYSHKFSGQAEEMMKEWISLVVERDRLLREQLDKVHSDNRPLIASFPGSFSVLVSTLKTWK